ncbi:MAG: dUTP diphosphatase [Bacteroidales bacterium]|nr:dUTP diphosphatase [Bacteroidales bacterium]
MKIKIVNTSSLPLPQYSTSLSAGMDLRADIEEPLTIAPLGRVLVPTGIRIELPEGYEAQIRPRSGLAAKHGVTVLNTPGTIDADYRGEIKVILVNLSDTPFTFQRGERIAQMVISSYTRAEWVETDELGESARGEGGFGHTGVK